MMPFAAYRAFWSVDVVSRLVGIAAMAGILTMILLTGSRGALLALACGGLFFGLTLPRRLALVFFGAGAGLFFAMLSLLSDQVIARFSTLIEMVEIGQATDKGVEGRLGAWMVGVQLFFDNPFFGVGAGNFNSLYQTTANELGIIFGGRDLSPHGLYLEVLSELGAVGLSIYLAILAFSFRGVLRAIAMLRERTDPRDRALCVAFGIAFFSHLVALVFLHGPAGRLLWTFVAVGIAMPAIVRLRLADAAAGSASAAEQATLRL
jgi:O-antigen ligase